MTNDGPRCPDCGTPLQQLPGGRFQTASEAQCCDGAMLVRAGELAADIQTRSRSPIIRAEAQEILELVGLGPHGRR